MAFKKVETKAMAHRQIAQNLHICMRLLEKFGDTLNWKSMGEIREVGDAFLNAALLNDGQGIHYEDYADAAEKGRKLMSHVWGVMLQDSSLDIVAPWVNTNCELAKKLEEDPGPAAKIEGLYAVPSVEQRMLALRDKFAEIDESNMTPFERLNHNRDLQSLGVGVDAATFIRRAIEDNFREEQAEGEEREEVRVSGLNLEVVNEAVLRSWMASIASKGALPKDQAIIMDALDHVEKYRHADAEARLKFPDYSR